MGIWGIALYGGDTAQDIQEEYKFQLLNGYTPTEAVGVTAKALQIFGNNEEDYLFWLIIADTQWNLGHLNKDTYYRAMEVLCSGKDEAFWSNSSQKNQIARGKILEKLRIKLNSPPPPPKALRKPKGKKCAYKMGDLLSVHMVDLLLSEKYQHLSPYRGKFAVVHVIGYSEVSISSKIHAPTNQHAIVLAYDWLGDEPGSLDIAQGSGVLDITRGTKDNSEFIFKLVSDYGRKEFEVKKIGNLSPPPNVLETGKYYSSPVSWHIISWAIASGYHDTHKDRGMSAC